MTDPDKTITELTELADAYGFAICKPIDDAKALLRELRERRERERFVRDVYDKATDDQKSKPEYSGFHVAMLAAFPSQYPSPPESEAANA